MEDLRVSAIKTETLRETGKCATIIQLASGKSVTVRYYDCFEDAMIGMWELMIKLLDKDSTGNTVDLSNDQTKDVMNKLIDLARESMKCEGLYE